MRIATWNVNSVKQRLPRLLPWLDERRPDVVCLQETKLADDAFADAAGRRARAAAATRSRPTASRPGTAWRSSRASGSRTSSRGLEGAPGLPAPRGARRGGDLRRDPRRLRLRAERPRARTRTTTDYKLAWLAALREHGRRAARTRRSCCGDMNIAPTDEDVFDPDAYVGQTHVTAPEREALRRAAGASACATSCATAGRTSACSPTGTTAPACSTRTSACGSTSCSPATRSPSASRRRGSTARRARARGRATTRR